MKIIVSQFWLAALAGLALGGCSSSPNIPAAPELAITASSLAPARMEWDEIIATAQENATPTARAVLQTVYQMVRRGEVIPGGCWDYLDEGFNRAGVPLMRRQTVFKTAPEMGRYADVDSLAPGDWLEFVNQGAGDVEHSGLFIGWVDKAAKEALLLGYAGSNRGEPGRYSVYDLHQIYSIVRP